MIIAIDGVAGSGKSSTARKVADILGFNYFTTGKMYRAFTLYCIENNLIDNLSNLNLSKLNNIDIMIIIVIMKNIEISKSNEKRRNN